MKKSIWTVFALVLALSACEQAPEPAHTPGQEHEHHDKDEKDTNNQSMMD